MYDVDEEEYIEIDVSTCDGDYKDSWYDLSAAEKLSIDNQKGTGNHMRPSSVILIEQPIKSQINGNLRQGDSAVVIKRKPGRPPKLKNLMAVMNKHHDRSEIKNKKSSNGLPKFLSSKIHLSKQSIAIKKTDWRKKVSRSPVTMNSRENLMNEESIETVTKIRRKPGRKPKSEILKLAENGNSVLSLHDSVIRKKPGRKPKTQLLSMSINAFSEKTRQESIFQSSSTGSGLKMRKKPGPEPKKQLLESEKIEKDAYANEIKSNTVPIHVASSSRLNIPRPKTPGKIKIV